MLVFTASLIYVPPLQDIFQTAALGLLAGRGRRSRGQPGASAGAALRPVPHLQAGACAERSAIPAKGLTGRKYDDHAFWDTDTFVCAARTYTYPQTQPQPQPTRCGGAIPCMDVNAS